jgi:3',5'-cyclic AMP phosphodiesterase CpdA
MARVSSKITRTLLVGVMAVGSDQVLAHGTSMERSRGHWGNAEIARGTVYLDRNANNVRDRGERGIGGVSVSNGIDVVQTDAQGRYKITLAPESILFISKPAEYEVPVDQNNLPQFYYTHYPNGTPPVAAFEYPVIEPTGALPRSIDFALLPGKYNEHSFKAMGFADPQAATDEEQDGVREDIVNELIGNPYRAAFGLVAGDVVDDTLSLYPRQNAMMGLIGIPIWNVPGNHDMNYDSPNDRYATETYKRYFGPTNFSFNHGQVHFIGLDNVDYKGAGQGEFDNGNYRGYLSPEQLQWIRNDLKFVPRDKLIVIFSHISLITYALDGRGERYNLGDNINTVNLAELVEILRPFRRVYAMAGHDTSNSWKVKLDHTHNWHGDWFLSHTLAEVRGNGWSAGPRDERDVRLATMEDGNPNGYYVISFNGTEVKPRFIPAKGDPNETMRIVLDPLLHGTRGTDGEVLAINRGALLPGTKLVVNLFDGGERDRVEVSIDGQPFVEMQNTLRTDPFMERQYQQYRGTDDAFSRPQPSSHIWEYALGDLTPGVHTARVRARDEFGQRSEKAFSFEVE